MGKETSPPSSVYVSSGDSPGSPLADHFDYLSHEDSRFERCVTEKSHASRTGEQEQLDLRVRIVGQQKRIDELASRLHRCEAECEALRINGAASEDDEYALPVSVDEYASARRGWFSKESKELSGIKGSMKLLVNINKKLRIENKRLQDIVDGTKTESEHRNDKDKRIIKALQKHNELLHQRLAPSERCERASSPKTAETSLETSLAEERGERPTARRGRSRPRGAVAATDLPRPPSPSASRRPRTRPGNGGHAPPGARDSPDSASPLIGGLPRTSSSFRGRRGDDPPPRRGLAPPARPPPPRAAGTVRRAPARPSSSSPPATGIIVGHFDC